MTEVGQKIGPYKLGKKLGQGAFGVVWFAVHEDTKEEVAIKTIPASQFKTDKYQQQQIDTEISVLRDLHHPCLNRLVDLIKTSKEIHMVLAYVGGGNLLNLMRMQHGVGLPMQRGFKLFWQITSALDYCHTRHICHRDIKAENVLLDSDMNAYLADFGMAKMVNGKTFTKCGSPHYMAPEVLKGKYDGNIADIWSLGVLAYGIFSGRLPFNERNISDTIAKAAKAEFTMPATFPADLQDLIRKMICVSTQQRITVEGIKKHQFWTSHCESFKLDAEGCNEGATHATGKLGEQCHDLEPPIVEKKREPPHEDVLVTDVEDKEKAKEHKGEAPAREDKQIGEKPKDQPANHVPSGSPAENQKSKSCTIL